MELWPEIQPWIIGCPLVAHNIGTEKKFLTKLAPLHRPGPWIDTLKLVRALYPDWPQYSLESLIEYFGITQKVDVACPGRAPHDALYDAIGCAYIFEYLLHDNEWDSLTVEELACIHPTLYHRRKSITEI